MTNPLYIVMRHGSFNEGEDHLNAAGYKQIEEATEQIKKLLPDTSIKLMNTVAGPRSIETAIILAKNFSITAEINGSDVSIQTVADIEALADDEHINLILVTNGKGVRRISEIVSATFAVPNPIQEKLPRGEVHVLVIDMTGKTVEQIVIR